MGTFDVAVIGLGAMGSAAAYHLAARGARVLGLDFKFSSVVGEILADLALDGATAQPIGFLSAARFTQDPS